MSRSGGGISSENYIYSGVVTKLQLSYEQISSIFDGNLFLFQTGISLEQISLGKSPKLIPVKVVDPT